MLPTPNTGLGLEAPSRAIIRHQHCIADLLSPPVGSARKKNASSHQASNASRALVVAWHYAPHERRQPIPIARPRSATTSGRINRVTSNNNPAPRTHQARPPRRRRPARRTPCSPRGRRVPWTPCMPLLAHNSTRHKATSSIGLASKRNDGLPRVVALVYLLVQSALPRRALGGRRQPHQKATSGVWLGGQGIRARGCFGSVRARRHLPTSSPSLPFTGLRGAAQRNAKRQPPTRPNPCAASRLVQ